jgi:hypothetical protein
MRPGPVELRKQVRYRLSASAVFAWQGANRSRTVGEGITRDISLGGAFILSSTCPPVGATAQLDVFLSPAHSGASRTVRFKTEATVTRIERPAAPQGFAVASRDLKMSHDGNGRALAGA